MKIQTEVLIVGGGATGVGISRDLSLRGIPSILIERGDFTFGASGRNHGLLHSGGRYAVSDPEAAREVRKGSRRIGEERFQAALRHQRAMYMKQPARGEHRLVIYSSYPAINGEIDY